MMFFVWKVVLFLFYCTILRMDAWAPFPDVTAYFQTQLQIFFLTKNSIAILLKVPFLLNKGHITLNYVKNNNNNFRPIYVKKINISHSFYMLFSNIV